MANNKHIFVSVINDLVTDNRVHKVCTTLTEMGFYVTLIGRKLPNSLPLNNRQYSTKRIKLLFNKGLLFYAEYNIRLFFLLLFSRFDILLSNDLDTLLANYLVSEIKSKPLVFDSHEYFTEVPEVINRPKVKNVWKKIERGIVPRIKYAYTVCQSIARLFEEEYGTKFHVIRNVPKKQEVLKIPEDKIISNEKKIVIYQGALNIGRGLPEVIEAMRYIDNALLVIAGDGDFSRQLIQLVQELHLTEKIYFTGRIPFEEVKFLTQQAHLGLSIEKDMGLNYRYALPNKLFDYIQAKVPVLVSNLPEMAALVKHYNIGLISDSHEPKKLAEKIGEALTNKNLQDSWVKNLEIAASELTWENEEKILIDIFSNFKE